MLYIDGQWRAAASGATFAVTDPATGKVLDHVADGGAADARAAIEAAARAFDGWAGLTAYQRSEKLYAAHQLMLERREDLAKLMTSEQGKPLRAARNEVGYAADFLLWFAEEAKRVYGQTIPSSRWKPSETMALSGPPYLFLVQRLAQINASCPPSDSKDSDRSRKGI